MASDKLERVKVPLFPVSITADNTEGYGMLHKSLECFGVLTAIAYSMLVASNTGNEVIGFALLFISALAIAAWAFLCKHYGMLLLQFFYAAAGIVGVLRWL
jgi:nicotinamide riboside transporter PnuC